MTTLRRLRCLLTGHWWVGYNHNPLSIIVCRRCGWRP